LLCDVVARLYHDLHHDFTSVTVHPHYGSYRDRSELWKPMPSNKTFKGVNQKYVHFFVGATQLDGTIHPRIHAKLTARTKLERDVANKSDASLCKEAPLESLPHE